jgi:hypothetical protein
MEDVVAAATAMVADVAVVEASGEVVAAGATLSSRVSSARSVARKDILRHATSNASTTTTKDRHRSKLHRQRWAMASTQTGTWIPVLQITSQVS